MEDTSQGVGYGTAEGDTLGLELCDTAGTARVVFLANCAEVPAALKARCEGTSLLLFDGTLWRDDEMIQRGEGVKTGRRMGHISMSRDNGAMAAFDGVAIGRRMFIHINNTNPALLADSPERQALTDAGWEVASDGLEIALP